MGSLLGIGVFISSVETELPALDIVQNNFKKNAESGLTDCQTVLLLIIKRGNSDENTTSSFYVHSGPDES